MFFFSFFSSYVINNYNIDINYTRGVFFKTVPKKTTIKRFSYDLVVLFTPIDIDSLLMNFKEIFSEESEVSIAAFGKSTQDYAEKNKFPTC